jgi:hypothetical protein
MLAVHITELDTGMPALLLGHLTLPELHDDIHRTDAVAHVVREVRADTEARSDTAPAIVSDLDSSLGI